MKFYKPLLLLCLVCTVFWSCKRNPLKVNLSGIEGSAEVVRFDNELFAVLQKDSLNGIVELSNIYPEFFNLFTYRFIRIGGIGDEHFPELIKQFVNDTLIQEVKTLVDSEFKDFNKTEAELVKSFRYFKYHFPEKEIPTVFAYVSGFNQSVVTAENIVGISLDKYLGRDCEYYRQLNATPTYKIQNMHKLKIPSDVAYAWAVTEFGESHQATTLLDNMVHEGKLMYFVDALLPSTHDTLKIGYTKKQLVWCKKNEAEMWRNLISRKLFYSNNRMDILR